MLKVQDSEARGLAAILSALPGVKHASAASVIEFLTDQTLN